MRSSSAGRNTRSGSTSPKRAKNRSLSVSRGLASSARCFVSRKRARTPSLAAKRSMSSSSPTGEACVSGASGFDSGAPRGRWRPRAPSTAAARGADEASLRVSRRSRSRTVAPRGQQGWRRYYRPRPAAVGSIVQPRDAEERAVECVWPDPGLRESRRGLGLAGRDRPGLAATPLPRLAGRRVGDRFCVVGAGLAAARSARPSGSALVRGQSDTTTDPQPEGHPLVRPRLSALAARPGRDAPREQRRRAAAGARHPRGGQSSDVPRCPGPDVPHAPGRLRREAALLRSLLSRGNGPRRGLHSQP